MSKPDIVVVAGTNRKNSLSGQVAHYYADLVRQEGKEAQVLDLIDLPADFTATALYENMGKNMVFNQLQAALEVAPKYVFIIPEYNGSFPGVFKAFIDGLPFPSLFKGKKCGLVGLSQGVTGGRVAISHLTDIFHYLKMSVSPFSLALGNIKDSRIETLLANEKYVKLLEEQVKEIINF
jgi:NAD(P)H-dependent FMN reductase